MIAYCRFLILLACFAAVSSCDNGEEPRKIVEPRRSDTAIYFPGGGGIDFGIKPTIDEVRKNNNGEYRFLSFKVNAGSSELGESIRSILVADGYSYKENSLGSYDVNETYRKEGFNSINVFMKQSFEPGFNKVTTLVIYWHI